MDVDFLCQQCQQCRQAVEECAVVRLLVEEVEDRMSCMVVHATWTEGEPSMLPAADPGEEALGEGLG